MDEVLFLASNQLSRIAAAAVNRTHDEPDQHIVAVLFSAAWVEAVTNEVVDILLRPERVADSPEYDTAAVFARAASLDDRTCSLQRKLSVLCAGATGAELPLGRKPWQHFTLLLDLRNVIVHMRPERVKVRPGLEDERSSLVTDEAAASRLVRGLLSAGAISAFPIGHMVPVTTAAQLPIVGLWSYRTAHHILDELSQWFPKWKGHILMSHQHPDQVSAAQQALAAVGADLGRTL